jgi:hypothetical protein
MPYATGETPEVGDYVKNQWEQPGRVTRVHFAQDDRVNFTHRASPQNDLGAARGPIRFELVRQCGKWDKQNRTSWSSAPALTRQDLSRKRSSFLLKQKNPTERE